MSRDAKILALVIVVLVAGVLAASCVGVGILGFGEWQKQEQKKGLRNAVDKAIKRNEDLQKELEKQAKEDEEKRRR